MSASAVQGLMLAFNKAIIERAVEAEMNLQLGYMPGDDKPVEQDNERNGGSDKTLLTENTSTYDWNRR